MNWFSDNEPNELQNCFLIPLEDVLGLHSVRYGEWMSVSQYDVNAARKQDQPVPRYATDVRQAVWRGGATTGRCGLVTYLWGEITFQWTSHLVVNQMTHYSIQHTAQQQFHAWLRFIVLLLSPRRTEITRAWVLKDTTLHNPSPLTNGPLQFVLFFSH